jgi:hypothetical protein
MTYSSKFVMCVLVNGKPLKERADGIVAIPLGAEYTIRFKNKNSRRAMVKFAIDGEDASGNGYVISAHSDIEIRRFADRDQTFKFVDLNSGEAQLEGKNGPNWDGSKGVIEAKFYLEKQYTPPPPPVYVPYPVPQPYPVPVYPRPWRRPLYDYNNPVWTDNTYPPLNNPFYTCSAGGKGMSAGVNMSCNAGQDIGPAAPLGGYESPPPLGGHGLERGTVPCSYTPPAAPPMTEGVTVGGSVSGQRFTTVYFDAENDYVTLRLVLRGTNEVVQQAVEEAEYCPNCGTKKGRKSDKFCGKCGTKL